MTLRSTIPGLTEILSGTFVCLALLAGTNAHADKLAEFRAGKIEVTLKSVDGANPALTGSGNYQLVLKPIGGMQDLDFDLTAKVFSLTKPTRLVVDLPNIGADSDQRITIADPLISTFRLGAHSDKTRFVLDVKNNAAATYNVRSDAGTEALYVDFSLTGGGIVQETRQSTTASSAGSKASQTSSSAESVSGSGSPMIEGNEPGDPQEGAAGSRSSSKAAYVFRNNDRVESLPPVVKSSGQRGVAPAQVPTAPAVVKGIFFQAPNDSKAGSVALDIERLNSYRLVQLSEETYELVIENAKLGGSHMILPQFPPDTFGGFQVLIAREEQNNIVIKIYVNSGTKLSPYRAQEKLWIRALEDDK